MGNIREKLPFLKGKKNISHFYGSNNIFVDCISVKFGLVTLEKN